MPKSYWKGKQLSEGHRRAISLSLRASNARRKAAPKPDMEAETGLVSVRGIYLGLWHELRVRAVTLNRTAGDLLSEAIREWLDKEQGR